MKRLGVLLCQFDARIKAQIRYARAGVRFREIILLLSSCVSLIPRTGEYARI